MECECFNAWSAKISFTGKSMYLGTARGAMANAGLMAAAFAVMLPRSESPKAADGYYGYYCPLETLGSFALAVEAQFPGGKVKIETKAQYFNMKEKIEEHPEVMEKLRRAFVNRAHTLWGR